jgi:aldehyde:ferredoxin oxidoreductase
MPAVYVGGSKAPLRKAHQILISKTEMRRYGTGYTGCSVGADTSSEPIRNWQTEWHDEKSYAGQGLNSTGSRRNGLTSTATNCMKVSCIKNGKWKGDITDLPDYELQAYCGTNLGLFEPVDNIHMSAIMDNLGHSGINGANTLGFAGELYQRGILTKDDIGFELKWGDVDAFASLARMMARREGIGDILAEGSYRAAIRIAQMKGMASEALLKYVIHVKGIEIGAHGTRSDQDFVHDISYAGNVQGGDHTSAAVDGYSDMSDAVFADSGVFCDFCRTTRGLEFDFAKAITGFSMDVESWRRETGPRIVTLQRAFLLMGGLIYVGASETMIILPIL